MTAEPAQAAEPGALSRPSRARRWPRLLGTVLALGVLAAAVVPLATGRLSSQPLQAQRKTRTACTLLGQGVARRDPATRTAAADLAATAATKDRRWLPLSQQLGVDAAGRHRRQPKLLRKRTVPSDLEPPDPSGHLCPGPGAGVPAGELRNPPRARRRRTTRPIRRRRRPGRGSHLNRPAQKRQHQR